MSKLVASGSIILGAVTALIAVLIAFHVNISYDEETAILGAVGGLLAVAGIWFHPAVPIGPTSTASGGTRLGAG